MTKCACSELDWSQVDQTAEHHPDCTRVPDPSADLPKVPEMRTDTARPGWDGKAPLLGNRVFLEQLAADIFDGKPISYPKRYDIPTDRIESNVKTLTDDTVALLQEISDEYLKNHKPHAHKWALVAKTVAAADDNLLETERETLLTLIEYQKARHGFTTILFSCECGEVKREELIGRDAAPNFDCTCGHPWTDHKLGMCTAYVGATSHKSCHCVAYRTDGKR
jgi:hypothetical protein